MEDRLFKLKEEFYELPVHIRNRINLNNLELNYKDLLISKGYRDIDTVWESTFLFKNLKCPEYPELRRLSGFYWIDREAIVHKILRTDVTDIKTLLEIKDRLSQLARINRGIAKRYGVYLYFDNPTDSTITSEMFEKAIQRMERLVNEIKRETPISRDIAL